MTFPDFFAEIPPLTLCDPLAETLGAAEGGLIEYHYADAVRLAGHSCPTVAGAWLMARHALTHLCPEARPQRGNFCVNLRTPQDTGTTGVVGAVLGLITGAAGEGGFKGFGGRHARRGLLMFGEELPAEVRIARVDTGAAVLLSYHPEVVPPSPEMPALVARVVGGVATAEESQRFAYLWQDRVRRILLAHGDDPAVLTVTPG